MTVTLGRRPAPLEGRERDLMQGILPLEMQAKDFRMVSDTAGKIREVFLGASNPTFLQAQLSLIRQMDPDVRFTVFAGRTLSKAHFTAAVKQAAIENPGRVVIHEINEGISPWIRNNVMVLDSEIGPVLLPGLGNPPGYTEKLLKADNRFLRLNPRELESLPRQNGGDVIHSTNATFVNAFTLGKKNPQKQATAHFLGANAIFVGENVKARGFDYKDLGDLDMWIAAAPPALEKGRLVDKTVFLADPMKALEVVDRMDEIGYKAFQDRVLRMYGITGPEDEYYGEFARHLTRSKVRRENTAASRALEGVKPQLASLGFRVAGLPHLNLMDARISLTYCNSLAESFISADGSHVNNRYMPVYGIKALDDEAAGAYRQEGYEVRGIEGLAQVLELKGSLRCITTVVSRSPYRRMT